MVEDEFLATAQTFTKHLHRAEYQRLKSMAKDRNAGTITSISRPTDGRTRMRAELRRGKQAEKVEAKTKAGVRTILTGAKVQGEGIEESELEMTEEEDDDDDVLWQGTKLQGFMSTGGRTGLKSLVGLQGVPSHTRAAAGLKRAESRCEETPKKASKGALPTDVHDNDEDEDEDTDDLDAPVGVRSSWRAPAPASAQTSTNGFAPSAPDRDLLLSRSRTNTTASSPSSIPKKRPPPPSSRAILSPVKPPSTPPSPSISPTGSRYHQHHRRRGRHHSPAVNANANVTANAKWDDQVFPPSHPPRSQAAIRAKLHARREKEAREREKKEEENGRFGRLKADEIPVFLV
ncbi:MAG: hypothetical protein Q9163_005508 [Psora crenata]